MQKQQVDVVAGVICKEDKILICRRKAGKQQAGLWEFPGGKIEKGESHQEALKREIQEELQINILPQEYITKVVHEYAHAVIVLWVYKAAYLEGSITPTDHDKTLWISAEELNKFELAPADQPVVPFLI